MTGVLLVIIAGGLLMTAVHTANEGGWLSFGQQQAFSLAWLVRPGTVLSSLVTGVFGVQPYPVRIEVAAWLVYVVPMVLYVLWPRRKGATRPAPTELVVGRDADPGVLAPSVAAGASTTS